MCIYIYIYIYIHIHIHIAPGGVPRASTAAAKLRGRGPRQPQALLEREKGAPAPAKNFTIKRDCKATIVSYE